MSRQLAKIETADGYPLEYRVWHGSGDAHSTLVFAHAPENDRAIHESHWFVRSNDTPMVAFSWAFFEEFALPPGEN